MTSSKSSSELEQCLVPKMANSGKMTILGLAFKSKNRPRHQKRNVTEKTRLIFVKGATRSVSVITKLFQHISGHVLNVRRSLSLNSLSLSLSLSLLRRAKALSNSRTLSLSHILSYTQTHSYARLIQDSCVRLFFCESHDFPFHSKMISLFKPRFISLHWFEKQLF